MGPIFVRDVDVPLTVEQQEVDVVDPEIVKAHLSTFFDMFMHMIPAWRQKLSLTENIHFCSDKELLPRDPAFADCFSDRLLSCVRPSSVDGPIATLQGKKGCAEETGTSCLDGIPGTKSDCRDMVARREVERLGERHGQWDGKNGSGNYYQF